jgi:hypothetical protein
LPKSRNTHNPFHSFAARMGRLPTGRKEGKSQKVKGKGKKRTHEKSLFFFLPFTFCLLAPVLRLRPQPDELINLFAVCLQI